MGNGTWNGSSGGGGGSYTGGGQGGSYGGSGGGGGGAGNGYGQGFPYPGGASGWEWDGGGAAAWSAGGGDTWNDSIWGNGAAAGKGRGKSNAGASREEDYEERDSAHHMREKEQQATTHRINGHFEPNHPEERSALPVRRLQGLQFDNRSEGTDSDKGDEMPPPASEAEIEEARQVVEKAMRQRAELDKNIKAAEGCSRDDLQAMINKRLAQK